MRCLAIMAYRSHIESEQPSFEWGITGLLYMPAVQGPQKSSVLSTKSGCSFVGGAVL